MSWSSQIIRHQRSVRYNMNKQIGIFINQQPSNKSYSHFIQTPLSLLLYHEYKVGAIPIHIGITNDKAIDLTKSIGLLRNQFMGNNIFLKEYSKRLLPSHRFSDVVTHRLETVNLFQPFRDILIHPPHNHYYLLMDFFYTIQIPTNGLVMEHSVSECSECI